MNKCIICGKGCQGKTCSGSCRAKLSRQSIDKQAGRTRTVEAHAHESDKRTDIGARPVNWGQPDCECYHCLTNKANGNKHTINHGAYKSASELADKELNRVSLPGDPDYDGCCIKVNGIWTTKEGHRNSSHTSASGQTQAQG